MPIHDQSYRRYGGSKAAPGRAWSVIARAGVMTMIRKRAFLGLLLFAWLPFVVRAVQIYVASNYPQTATFFPSGEIRGKRSLVSGEPTGEPSRSTSKLPRCTDLSSTLKEF
jgi:hypothetical protein